MADLCKAGFFALLPIWGVSKWGGLMVGVLLGKPSKNGPPTCHRGVAGDHAVGNTPCVPHVKVEDEEGNVFLRNQGTGEPH